MDDKYKIGRPKLADKSLVNESIVIVGICIIMIAMLISVGINTPSLTSLKGSINSDDCFVKSYKVSDISVKLIMSCNSNVKDATLMGTKLKQTTNGLVGYKLISLDSKKEVNYDWNNKYNGVSINRTYVIQNK